MKKQPAAKKTATTKKTPVPETKVLPTIVSFVLDETGSMQSCRKETISGFNEYINTLKTGAKDGNQSVRFSLTKFNSAKIEMPYVNASVQDVAELTPETYVPANTTPLYDAVGNTITKVSAELKDSGKEAKLLFVIMTDGQENASTEYNQRKIFDLIKEKEKENWTFIFLGANQDSWLAGHAIGVSRGNTMNYDTYAMHETLTSLGDSSLQYMRSPKIKMDKFFEETKYNDPKKKK